MDDRRNVRAEDGFLSPSIGQKGDGYRYAPPILRAGFFVISHSLPCRNLL